jgi:glycosyltransferase involved in cell wall biosynthesis
MTEVTSTSQKRRKPVILVLLGCFWPGNDSSGVNPSFKSLATALAAEFEFKVIARDRAEGAPSPAAPEGIWIDQGVAAARYCRPHALGANGLHGILRATPHDLLLMNGFFDREFTIPALIMRRLGRMPRRPAIVSPHGEFSPGALDLKKSKKSAYITFARSTGLLSDVWLHGTGDQELSDIKAGFPWARGYFSAENIREVLQPAAQAASGSTCTRLIFISRISRKKNLDFALRSLALVNPPVSFDIYGPCEEKAYWQECLQLISALPAHIEVHYRGEIQNSAVPQVLAAADVFFLPTRGENFCYAIFESLSCGVPVLTSDQTPWRCLGSQEAGWDLPLGDPAAFAATIDLYATMDADRKARLRLGARRLAEKSASESEAVAKTREMFAQVLASGHCNAPLQAKG